MSKSISLHKNYKLLILSLFIFEFLLIRSVAAAPQLFKASPQDIREASKHLSSVLKDQLEMPEQGIVSVEKKAQIYWSAGVAGKIILLPINIRYSEMNNAYCRLVLISENLKDAKMVDLPTQANFDDCLGVADLQYLDINGDGYLDVVESVRIKSNVGNFEVTEQLVYLSNETPGTGYCYSEQASHQLEPLDMTSAEKIVLTLEKQKKRLAISQWECYAP